MLPCFSPSPTPEANGGGGLWGSPPPTLHWTQFSMGQGALWGGSAPLLDPHSTQRGGGAMGQPPCIQPPSLIPIWGRGALWGGAAPLLDPPPPIAMGALWGTAAPLLPPPNPGLGGGGGDLWGSPPWALNLILYGAVGAMGQHCPASGPPPSQWGLYGAVLPHFSPPLSWWGGCGAPPPLTSNPTLIPIWGSRRYGAAPSPPAPPAMG